MNIDWHSYSVARMQAKDYIVFFYFGLEHGHRALLTHIGAKPLLALGLRVGEGTGALLAWHLQISVILFVAQMAGFESTGVVQKN